MDGSNELTQHIGGVEPPWGWTSCMDISGDTTNNRHDDGYGEVVVSVAGRGHDPPTPSPSLAVPELTIIIITIDIFIFYFYHSSSWAVDWLHGHQSFVPLPPCHEKSGKADLRMGSCVLGIYHRIPLDWQVRYHQYLCRYNTYVKP